MNIMMHENFGMDWKNEAVCILPGRDYFIDKQKQVIRIYTAKGLVWFAQQMNEGGGSVIENRLVVLEADIDLGGREWEPIGGCGETYFGGVFDGQGHVVRNLTIFGNYKYSGFFSRVKGCAEKSAVICNLCLEDVRIDCWGKAGTLAGEMEYAEVRGCSFTGSVVSGNEAGGVAAFLENCKVTSCYSLVKTKSLGLDAGGIAANIRECSMEYCFASGGVEGQTCAGGMVATVSGSSISGCFASGVIIGMATLGGLVGVLKKSSYIEYSYSTAKVGCRETCWENSAGGLFGQNDDSFDVVEVCRLKNCYAAGVVEGKGRFAGSFCGSGFGKMEKCWYEGSLNHKMPAVGKVIEHFLCQDFPLAVEYRKGIFDNEDSGDKWFVKEGFYPQLPYFAEHPDAWIREASMESARIK